MLTSAQNLAVVRTELDRVFKQEFEYDDTTPSIATANTSALFKPMNIDRQAYIEEIFMGGGLFPKIGEIQTVPVTDIKVANKMITAVLDFADSRELSKNWFDCAYVDCRTFAHFPIMV